MRFRAIALLLLTVVPPLAGQSHPHHRLVSEKTYRTWRNRTFIAAYDEFVSSLNQFADAYDPEIGNPAPRDKVNSVRKAWRKLGVIEPWFKTDKSDAADEDSISEARSRPRQIRVAYNDLISALETFMLSYARQNALIWPADKAAAVRTAWHNLELVEPAFAAKR